MLVMFSLLALSVVGTGILTERSWRTWDRLRATPARAGELLAAKALPAFALLIVLQAEVIAFGAGVFGPHVPTRPCAARPGRPSATPRCWPAWPPSRARSRSGG